MNKRIMSHQIRAISTTIERLTLEEKLLVRRGFVDAASCLGLAIEQLEVALEEIDHQLNPPEGK